MNEDVVRVELTDIARTELAQRAELVLPQLIVDAGPAAVEKFPEFFAARIANRRTRAAYGRAVGQFLAWCAARGLGLTAVSPLHVAAYIRTHPGSAPTVKQHLAAIRMLGDWLVVSQVIPVNPAAAVRGPKHVVTTGATPVLSPAEARRLLAAIDTGTLAGRRDRALVSVMLYSVARVSAVIGMRRQDYFRQERQGWLRLHEKGGTRHDVPAHHRAAEALDDYLERGRARRGDGGALPERRPRGAAADGPGALAASRPGNDQAAGGGGGSPALDLLPHVPGDGDHGVSVEWGDARTRAADRRARLPEDDEALRPDGGHDHRRRDRAHRDLGGGRPARRRAPRDVRAARRDGRAASVRVRHVGCRVAKTLDSVWRLRLVPPGGWGVSAARRWRAAPPRVGALWPHTRRVRQARSMVGWPACPGPVFARRDRMSGGTPGCGVRSDRARGSGTQAQPVEGRGRARDRHVRRRDPALHRIGEGGFDCRVRGGVGGIYVKGDHDAISMRGSMTSTPVILLLAFVLSIAPVLMPPRASAAGFGAAVATAAQDPSAVEQQPGGGSGGATCADSCAPHSPHRGERDPAGPRAG